MLNNPSWKCVVAVAALTLLAAVAQAVTIDLVTVGNPGNDPDTRYATPGYGAVDYVYQIGKFEVTAGQYCEFLNAVAATDTYGLYNLLMLGYEESCMIWRIGGPGRYSYSVEADWANRPVNYVSWGDAARFSNWLHNGQPTGVQDLTTTEDGAYYLNGSITDDELLATRRNPDATWVLSSEDEWYKAAYYDPNYDGPGAGGYWDYPCGSNSEPSNVLTDPDPGNNGNFYTGESPYYTIGSPYYRTEVGDFENSESPYGTFDQGGNVWEWNEAVLPPLRGVRGGGYQQGMYLAHSSRRKAQYPANEYGHKGFRVAYVPEPSTTLLLTVAAFVLAAYGWRRRRAA